MVIDEETIYHIIQDTWNSTLGFPLDRLPAQDFCASEAFTVCVRITGAWEGEVSLHCASGLARRIGAAIFQVDVDKVGSYEILDALSEIIHIVGGNVKALLPQPVALSFPSMPDPTIWAQATGHWKMLCRQTMMSEGYPFSVTLWGDLTEVPRAKNPSEGESGRPAQ